MDPLCVESLWAHRLGRNSLHGFAREIRTSIPTAKDITILDRNRKRRNNTLFILVVIFHRIFREGHQFQVRQGNVRRNRTAKNGIAIGANFLSPNESIAPGSPVIVEQSRNSSIREKFRIDIGNYNRIYGTISFFYLLFSCFRERILKFRS